MQPLVRRKPGACVLNMRRGITDASRRLRVPATATKLSESPSGKSQAATGETQTEKLTELRCDGLTCALRGAAGNACSIGICMADCAEGMKKRADPITKKWKQNITPERKSGSEDIKGSFGLEPNWLRRTNNV